MALHRQGEEGHVVGDADGEAVFGRIELQVVEHGLDLGRVRILGGEAVASAYDQRRIRQIGKGGDHVLIQGLAGGTHLLAAVQHGDAAAGSGQGRAEALHGEGPVETDLQEAHLFAAAVQVSHHLADSAGHRAHGHDDPLRVRGAVVVEQTVRLAVFAAAAGDAGDLRQIVLHDVGHGVVEAVVGLPELEIDVRVLHRVAQGGMLRIQGLGPETLHRLHIQQGAEILVIDGLDLLDLVGGAEAVEKVQAGDAALDGGQMGHAGGVHDLLHRAGGDDGPAGAAAVHHVGLVAEDGHGVGAHGAGGHVQHGGLAGTGDAVHHRQHEHQPLGAGKGRAEGPGLGGAVDRADGAGLGLHLHQGHGLPEQVPAAVGRPFVGLFRHGRAGGDGVDGRHLGESVGRVGRRFVAVHNCDSLVRHCLTSVYAYASAVFALTCK